MDDIDSFLAEDLDKRGDITTQSLYTNENGSASIVAKEPCILAGVEESLLIFGKLGCKTSPLKSDGDELKANECILTIEGPLESILSGERLALNFISRMSGIATTTHELVKLCKKKNPAIEIAATRKTTPGFRKYEKKAVCIGGGIPHRMGLYDGILIKDNHLAGLSIREAIRKSRTVGMKVEIEVESTEDAIIAAEEGADIIMLDNMPPAKGKITASKIREVNPQTIIEVSGGITPDTIANYTFANRISLGWLTHSIKNKDFSLVVDKIH